MSDSNDVAAAAASANTATATAAPTAEGVVLLRCSRCGLVLNNPKTGLLQKIPNEAHNGRCLFCFPLPTRENVAEMRKLQVEEYRLRLEMTRGSPGPFSQTDDPVATATCRNASFVNDAIAGAADRNTTFDAMAQAMPVTPAAAIGCQGHCMNGREHRVSPASPSVDSQGQSQGPRPCHQDEGQGQVTTRYRPRTLLKDDIITGHPDFSDRTDTSPSTTRKKDETEEEEEEEEEKEDMAVEDAAPRSLLESHASEPQTSGTRSPSLATATVEGGGGSSGPAGSLFSIVAMFEAQEREDDDDGGGGADDGIEEIIMAIDGECAKGSEDEVGSNHNNIHNGKREDALDKSHASAAESPNASFSPSPSGRATLGATTVQATECQQKARVASLLSPVKNESDDDEKNPPKRIRYSAPVDTNDPLFKEIETYVSDGQKDNLSLGQRDVCIEKLRLMIEDEESIDSKKQHANTMISLEAPKMIVVALRRVMATFVSLKKAKARNACARYMSECCHTLATLAYYGRAQSIVDIGAVVAVISALELNKKVRNPRLYLHGIEALQTLSVCATDEILESQGLVLISTILIQLQTKISSNSSRDTKHTLRMIMKLLDNMSSSSRLGTPEERDNEDAERARVIGQGGLLKPILEVIVNLPDDVDLQLAVCSAVASLSASEDNCNEIVQLGGIRSLVFLSHRHPLSPDLQIAIADCFAWLVADQVEIQIQACEDGVVKTCVGLLKDTNMAVVHSALYVLDIVGESKEGVKHLLDASAISAVTALAEKAAHSNNDDFHSLCQNFLGRLHVDFVPHRE